MHEQSDLEREAIATIVNKSASAGPVKDSTKTSQVSRLGPGGRDW